MTYLARVQNTVSFARYFVISLLIISIVFIFSILFYCKIIYPLTFFPFVKRAFLRFLNMRGVRFYWPLGMGGVV